MKTIHINFQYSVCLTQRMPNKCSHLLTMISNVNERVITVQQIGTRQLLCNLSVSDKRKQGQVRRREYKGVCITRPGTKLAIPILDNILMILHSSCAKICVISTAFVRNILQKCCETNLFYLFYSTTFSGIRTNLSSSTCLRNKIQYYIL